MRFDQVKCRCGEIYQVTRRDYEEYLSIKNDRRTFTRGIRFECEVCGDEYPFDFMELTSGQITQLED